MIKKLVRLLFLIAPFCYMLFIWILSSLPHDAILDTPFSFDLLLKESLHLIEFGILYGFFVLFLIVRGKMTKTSNTVVAAVAIGYGFIDELHQYFVPYRSATVIDLVKDTIGVLVLYWIIRNTYFSEKPSKLKSLLQKLE